MPELENIQDVAPFVIQWNLSVTTTFIIEYITCDVFSNVF